MENQERAAMGRDGFIAEEHITNNLEKYKHILSNIVYILNCFYSDSLKKKT